MKDVHPIWLDVQNGKVYPVFDVLKGSGTDGKFTYPDDDPSAPRTNTYTLPTDGVLVKTFGHLHPGGLHDTFSVTRGGQNKEVFTSKAKYYEPAGAVSWDVSMTATPDDWEVAVKAGDELSLSTTYDTSRASWYESMGLAVVWMYDGPGGTDPFTGTINQKGVLTHGHLPENDNHGGGRDRTRRSPEDGGRAPDHGHPDRELRVRRRRPRGQGQGPDRDRRAVDHVRQPRRRRTERVALDHRVQGAVHRVDRRRVSPRRRGRAVRLRPARRRRRARPPGATTWSTPTDLDPGTYTYFCRVHPFMRGAFRVVPPGSG